MAMNFSQVLEAMKAGKRIKREKYPKNHLLIDMGRIHCQIADSALIPVGVNWFLGSDDIMADDWEVVK